MSALAKLFHRTKPAVDPALAGVACPHTTLIPRWANAEDMGHGERVSSYACDSCGQVFTAAEGRLSRVVRRAAVALHRRDDERRPHLLGGQCNRG